MTEEKNKKEGKEEKKGRTWKMRNQKEREVGKGDERRKQGKEKEKKRWK